MNELKRTFKARETIIRMLINRKYDKNYIGSRFFNTTIEEFKVQFNNKNDCILDINDGKNIRTIVIFYYDMSNSISKKDNFKKIFYNYVDTIDTPFKIILISKQILTEQDRKKILTQLVPNELEEIGRNIEVELFNELELQYDPTLHDLVPKHIILTKEEKKNVLQQFNLTLSQLPKLSNTDVIARYYNMKNGDLIKIIRTSPSAGKCITYRAVC